ncbi:hypothetical protein PV325_009519, partial [Microctonus aethiopoides]
TNERESSATLTTSEGELRLFAYDCPDSFSGSVTVTMAGSNNTGGVTGNIGHATVNTNSQTHISSEQQLPIVIFNKVKSRSAHMKSHRPMPTHDSTDSKKQNVQQQTTKQLRIQQQQQQQQNISSINTTDCQHKITSNSETMGNSNLNNLWHNPTRLRPP